MTDRRLDVFGPLEVRRIRELIREEIRAVAAEEAAEAAAAAKAERDQHEAARARYAAARKAFDRRYTLQSWVDHNAALAADGKPPAAIPQEVLDYPEAAEFALGARPDAN